MKEFPKPISRGEESSATEEELVLHNLRMGMQLARDYGPVENASLDDRFQAACMGLVEAAKRFDRTRGTRFMTYAGHYVRKHLGDMERAARCKPKWSPVGMRSWRSVEGMEMDQWYPDESSGEGLVAVEEVDHRQWVQRKIRDLLGRLSPRDQEILRMRFGLDGSPPMCLREIQYVVGLTKERVRQIVVRCLRDLRQLAEEEGMAA